MPGLVPLRDFPPRLRVLVPLVANPQPGTPPAAHFGPWAALKRAQGRPIGEAAEARLPPPWQPGPAAQPEPATEPGPACPPDSIAAAMARTLHTVRALKARREGGAA